MYRVTLESGELTLDTENPGDVLGWLTDAKFEIRGAIAMNPVDGSTTFRTRDTLDRSSLFLVTPSCQPVHLSDATALVQSRCCRQHAVKPSVCQTETSTQL